MSAEHILVASIALRTLALFLAVGLLAAQRDRRLLALVAMLALMTLRQVLTLATMGNGSPPDLAMTELPGLAVSALALAAVVMLYRVLTEQQDSVDRLQALFDHLPVLVEAVDARGRTVLWNREAERVTGYSSAEMTAAPGAWARLYRDGDERARVARERLLAMRRPHRFLARVTTRQGEQRIIECASIWPPPPFTDWAAWGIGIDVTDRVAAERALAERERALAALSRHLEQAREEERGHIAREVHDHLGQLLTSLRLDLAWLRDQLPEPAGPLQQRTTQMLSLVDETLAAVRRIAASLRPPVLDDLGLGAALEWLAGEFERHTGIGCELSLPSREPDLDEDTRLALFRVAQEALTNVARHAGASLVEIALEPGDDAVHLRVSDDGAGFDPERVRESGLGLVGARERIGAVGGRIDIDSTPGGGTRIGVTVPHAGAGARGTGAHAATA